MQLTGAVSWLHQSALCIFLLRSARATSGESRPPPPPSNTREVLEWPHTIGGAPQTKVTTVGKNEIYNRENLVGPFLVHKIWVPDPPPPSPQPQTQSPVVECIFQSGSD